MSDNEDEWEKAAEGISDLNLPGIGSDKPPSKEDEESDELLEERCRKKVSLKEKGEAIREREIVRREPRRLPRKKKGSR